MKRDTQPRSLNRRQFLTGSAAAVGGLALASHGVAARTAPAFLRAQEQTEVLFWFFDTWPEEVIEAFHQQNPNIRVNLQQLSYADVHNRLLTSLAAGSGAPDLVGIELGFIGAFTSQGGLTDLYQAPFSADQFAADWVEYKVQQGSSADGRLVALPWDIGPAGLIYRADLFEAAGIDPDPAAVQERVTTWEDWYTLGEELKAETPDVTLMADAIGNDIFYPMVEQQGHGWFDGNKVVIEEKGTEPLQMALDARARGLDLNVPPGSPEWAAALRNDEFAAGPGASWGEIGVKREQPQTVGKWRLIHAPEGDLNIGGSFLAIPEQSEKKEAAWEFAKFITASVDGSLIGVRAGGVFPAYKPAWEDPVFDQPVEYYGDQLAYRLFLDIAQGVPGFPIHQGQRQADDIVSAELTRAETEDKDPVQAMKDAEAEVLERVDGTTA